MPDTDQDVIEQMIDRLGTRGVLEIIASIAHDKADHLRSNWQDEGAARQWERDARTIEKTIPRLVV
jgi:hypothetical protein